LKTGFGKYVGVANDGKLIAITEAVGPRERFEAVFQDVGFEFGFYATVLKRNYQSYYAYATIHHFQNKCAIQSASSGLFLSWAPDKEGNIYVSSKTAKENEFINVRINIF
jgi:hypothetical protein